MNFMKCHICKTIKHTPYQVTELDKEKTVKSFKVCKKCREKYMQNSKQKSNELNLTEIITPEQLIGFLTEVVKKQEKTCSCGMTETEFDIEGRFGCSKCYELFDDKMQILVYPYHAANEHVGKVPKQLKANKINNDPIEKEKFLKLNYAYAIELEEYEKAALIKKQLDLLK